MIENKWEPAPFPGISEIFLNWDIYINLTLKNRTKSETHDIIL
jgi:hypothetical protein